MPRKRKTGDELPAAIKEVVDDFLITKRLEEGRSENTINAYRHDLLTFFGFLKDQEAELGVTLGDIGQVKVQFIKRFLLYLNKRGYTKAGLARKIASIKSFFNHAHFMGYIQVNPTSRIKSPKISRTENLPKFLTAREINQILDHVRKRRWINEYILLRFMYATMCRVSEVCNVKVGDVDFYRVIVRLRGKGNKERWVPVDDDTLILVKQLILPKRKGLNDALFTNKRGTPIQPRVIQNLFQKIKAEMNFPEDRKITPHVFRHTGATMLRRNGMDISELQDILGHASPNTTMIYAKNDINTLRTSYKSKHPLSTA
ncbi:MAG: tyrosine-type recombinase/integrase [Promethearchaeota archaeon]